MRLKRGWVFLVALILQMAAERAPWSYAVLMPISYGLLLAGTLSNLHRWGFKILLAGVLLNLLPLIAHHWYMPVAGEALLAAGFPSEAGLVPGAHLVGSQGVLLSKEATAFWFLTDIIPVRWPIRVVLSPGDLVILGSPGFLTWDIVRMLAGKRHKQAP